MEEDHSFTIDKHSLGVDYMCAIKRPTTKPVDGFDLLLLAIS